MQVVQQLEIQLQKEKERLAAMMSHLHQKHRAQLNSSLSLRLSSSSGGSGSGTSSGPNDRIPTSSLMKGLSSGSFNSDSFDNLNDSDLNDIQSQSRSQRNNNLGPNGLIRTLSSSPPSGVGAGHGHSLIHQNNISNQINDDIKLIHKSPSSSPPINRDNVNVNREPGPIGPGRRRLSDKTTTSSGNNGNSNLVIDTNNGGSLPDSPARRRIAERTNLDITEGRT